MFVTLLALPVPQFVEMATTELVNHVMMETVQIMMDAPVLALLSLVGLAHMISMVAVIHALLSVVMDSSLDKKPVMILTLPI